MEHTRLTFFIPFEAVEEGRYSISLSGRKASIHIKTIQRSKEDFQRLTGISFKGSKGGSIQILDDVWGISKFSEVTLEAPFYIPIENTRIIAQRYLNRLIRAWRCCTRKHWIPNVPDSAILNIRGESKSKEGHDWVSYASRDPKRLQYPVKTFEATEVMDNIRDFLINEKWIPIYEELRLSARNHFVNGQFNIAVIEMNIALESLASRYLREKLRQKEFEKEKIVKQMNKYHSKNYGLKRILDEAFKEVDNRSLKREVRLWKKFNKARNQTRKYAVHPWIKILDESDAREALYTFELVMKWIMR